MPVDVPAPVEILDVAARAGADKPGRDDLLALKPAFLVERVAVHQTARALAGVLALAVLLDDHPFREGVDPDRELRLAGRGRVGRWRVQLRVGHAGEQCDLAGEPRLDHLLQPVGPGPRVQAGDDARVLWQVDQRPGAPGRDHLAAADLSVRGRHQSLLIGAPRMSRSSRFTLGSTSRSERFTRNLRWFSLMKSVSSMSRSSGCAVAGPSWRW